ncbi:hypothetical protein BDR04DRAFT_1117910 [Suillus decipiens]|nr:hypothetical protein BDR04DRAFT_1117910 [Suillus decipiens]
MKIKLVILCTSSVVPCFIHVCAKRASSNPLVLHSRHFGQTVFALCNYPALLTASVLQLVELEDSSIEDYPVEVFMELIDSYPGLLARLMDGEEEDIILLGEFVLIGQMQSKPYHTIISTNYFNTAQNQAGSEEQQNCRSMEGVTQEQNTNFRFKHVFMSLSSVEKESKATRSGNAYLCVIWSFNVALQHIDNAGNFHNQYLPISS